MSVSTDKSVGLMVPDVGAQGHRSHEYIKALVSTPAFLKSLQPSFSLGMLVCAGLWVSGADTFSSLNESAECCISLGSKVFHSH